ncbi:MAG: di-trans,poly-cis-decaprenylcistransferase [Phenylobacterium sp.]|nr:di-trans,poly-cis-decaprenylcistransferase [Phenylobacterium sp.]MCA3726127.1 di-trans,poly-cis-decaprenylcistransferase [Phenylobacterium sp.]MCA6255476.1 di-trans,poly-cis-decaprenylcistransferase [Phenylobacterium sp.]MCA6261804.1 di-trans,poly-cis-decaprenylcistransferase [Phenylobacterium sp.]MCA6335009.1 di-trans,poly-cis-decaprenylcistransferase [Phenylobacterium sp.]
MAGRSKTSPEASGPASAASAAGGPLHVAIVMDGNGRWAQKRGLPRTLGHRAGVEALRRTVAAAPDLGVRWLTVYGFSTENWSRPAAEVRELMALPKRYFDSDLKRLEREGVRVRAVGRREGLAPDLVALLNEAEQRTAHNDRFFLQIAFNYGGQADIADAARRLAEAAAAGRLDPATITESVFAGSLSTAGLPLPDLIIRPSGEQRLSNFLLWEAAYAELVFQDVLWPDYDAASLADAITAFRSRDRRFGGAVSVDVLVAG